jgi:hypothetical protein
MRFLNVFASLMPKKLGVRLSKTKWATYPNLGKAIKYFFWLFFRLSA